MNLKYGYIFGFALVAAFGLLPLGNDGCASGIAPQTCDTQVWQTMEMRAKMETEREIMQNQNLIFKPDSILSYTCFDKFAAHASLYGGSLFTHTKYWGGTEIIKWGDNGNYVGMDKAMENVVTKSMETYMTANYDHAMLGGRGSSMPTGGAGGGSRDSATSGLNTYKTTQVPSKGGDYSCNQMGAVWKAAKCMNFIHNANFSEDGFHPYLDLKGHNGGQDIAGYQTYGDVRKFPANMACNTSTPVDGNAWDQAWLKSRNEDSFGSMNKFYKYSEPLNKTFTDVREKVEPGQCGDPILTGVSVVESAGSGDDYADGVCTNPGCVFKKSGDEGSCVLASGSSPSATSNPTVVDRDRFGGATE